MAILKYYQITYDHLITNKGNKMDIRKEVTLRSGNIKHTLHALKEEAQDNITAEQVENSLKYGFDIIEEYSDDPRGLSLLLLCFLGGLPVHVVCAPHEDTLIIITVYRPDKSKWTDGFKKRR